MQHDVVWCEWANSTDWLFSTHEGGVFVCDWLLFLHRATCHVVFLISCSADFSFFFFFVWYALFVCACVRVSMCVQTVQAVCQIYNNINIKMNNTADRIVVPFSNSLVHLKMTPGCSHMYAWSLWWLVKRTWVVWCCDVLTVGCLFTSFQNLCLNVFIGVISWSRMNILPKPLLKHYVI